MREVTVKIHEIAVDGLPGEDDDLVGRIAFLFDGCIVTGWPLRRDDPDMKEVYLRHGWWEEGDTLWEADTDVGHNRPFARVTHWVEFPLPIWEYERMPSDGV